MILEFLLYGRRLQNVQRFSIWNKIKPQSVAEHCYNVSLYAMVLADLERGFGNTVDMEKIFRMCLIHDLEEAVTGDIMHDFKYNNPNLLEMIQRFSLKCFHDMVRDLPNPLPEKYIELKKIIKNDDSIEDKIVEAVDNLDVLLWAVEERRLGNSELDPLIQKNISQIKSIKLKSADMVMEEAITSK